MTTFGVPAPAAPAAPAKRPSATRDDRLDGGTFAVRTSWVGRVAVLHCVGTLDALGAPTLDKAVTGVLGERPAGLVLDFGDLRHLETVGLRTVLSAQHRVRSGGCTLALASIPPQVAEFLRRLCVDRSLAAYPTVLDAARGLVSAAVWR